MILFVSGFQRCGSSLVMQMLAAGGMPIVHDPEMGYPSYETTLNLSGAPLDAYDGHALKWLEPLHVAAPPVPFNVATIWLTRNHKEQSRSAVKFMRALPLTSADARSFKKSYDRDERPSVDVWRKRGPVLVLPFERLLREPGVAEEIALFVEANGGLILNPVPMQREVRPRGVACLPYLLEVQLIEERAGVSA